MAKGIIYQKKPWLRNYEDGVPEYINYKETKLFNFLETSAVKFPDKMALNFQGYTVSFSELDSMVNKFANSLADFGIKKGDRVAILLPNLIPCVVAYYSALKIGAISVMNNPLYSDRELEHQFNDSQAKVLITLDLLGNRMIDLRSKTSLKQIVYTSIGDYLPFPKNLIFPFVGKKKGLSASVKAANNVFKWKKLIKKYDNSKPEVDIFFDDVAMYQYTGGTTGISKGVMLTHGNLSKQVQQISSWFPNFDDKGVMLGALPFFHVFGLSTSMNFAIYKGWGNILVPKPQPTQLLEAISKFKATFAPMVPTMYIGLLEHPEIDKADLTSIKGCFSGSAPLPVEVINDFEKRTGATIVEGFGMTESSPVTHINPFGGRLRKVGSVGIPISDTESKIVDIETGENDMAVGEPGELLIRGPQVTEGYWQNVKATKDTIINGWLHTGDIAKMDKDGYFYIVDRKKDMIISGGFNVYPRDIEEVLFENIKVLEATAIGIPHKKRGEAVKVFIVLKEGEKASAEEIMEYCREKLAKYKWPVEIEFIDELPRTAVGKVLKKDLRTT